MGGVGLMNQIKKVINGMSSTCLAGNDSVSDANTQSAVAMLFALQTGELK